MRASVTGPVPGPSATTAIRGIPGDTRVHKRGRGHPGQARAVALGSTWSRIHNLRLRQRLLRLELRDAKRRLMVPDSRWTYDRQYSSLLSLVRE